MRLLHSDPRWARDNAARFMVVQPNQFKAGFKVRAFTRTQFQAEVAVRRLHQTVSATMPLEIRPVFPEQIQRMVERTEW